MHQTLKRHWLALSRGKPGRRFQDRYAKAKRARVRGSWAQQVRRFLLVFAALGALVIGVFLMFVPGPAVLFYFLAGTLLASESLYLARLMDWTEVRLRTVWKWGRRRWEEMSMWARCVVVAVVVGLSVAVVGLAYLMFIR